MEMQQELWCKSIYLFYKPRTLRDKTQKEIQNKTRKFVW